MKIEKKRQEIAFIKKDLAPKQEIHRGQALVKRINLNDFEDLIQKTSKFLVALKQKFFIKTKRTIVSGIDIQRSVLEKI